MFGKKWSDLKGENCMDNDNNIGKRSYTIVYNDFLDCKLLSTNEKMLVITIKRFGNKAFPSIGKLSEISGLSRSTVKRTLTSLKDKGIIKVINRKSSNNVNESNIYILNDNPEMWTASDIGDLKQYAKAGEIAGLVKTIKASGYDLVKIDGSNVMVNNDNNTIIDHYIDSSFKTI